jgi:hypothetical protein
MKTARQHNAEMTGSVEFHENTRYIPVSAERKDENLARAEFERWAKEGTKPFLYPLERLAGGDYVSVHTEHAWRAFRAGWNAR